MKKYSVASASKELMDIVEQYKDGSESPQSRSKSENEDSLCRKSSKRSSKRPHNNRKARTKNSTRPHRSRRTRYRTPVRSWNGEKPSIRRTSKISTTVEHKTPVQTGIRQMTAISNPDAIGIKSSGYLPHQLLLPTSARLDYRTYDIAD